MSTPIDLDAALAHFEATDTTMHNLLARGLSATPPLATPTPKPTSEYFATIVTSIISQQISTKAADAVRGRVLDTLGTLTPERIQNTDHELLRSCGLSRQKVRYITENAAIWEQIPYTEFAVMEDSAVVAELTKLYGVGRWTAEMFCMFSLARPDVFSYGDLGLMQSLYRNYGYYPHYRRKIQTTVNAWAPHRTAASLALWYATDNEPVLL